MSKSDPIQTEYTPEERERMLDGMRQARDVFYNLAVRIGFHQYVEFAGFLGEFIKICEHMHKDGRDFGTNALDPADHELEYIGEKFGCVFGSALAKPHARRVFWDALAHHGGWTDEPATKVEGRRREAKLESALHKILEHVFVELPIETAPPNNRLQVIAAVAQLALDEAEETREPMTHERAMADSVERLITDNKNLRALLKEREP